MERERMRRNFWTVLLVFVCIFALAWLLSRVRATAASQGATVAHTDADRTPEETAAAQSLLPQTSSETPPVASRVGEPGLYPPVADSIARNPPEGMLFAGRGRFQLYRQGDITWRLDTDTGEACVIFATDEQWQIARVYERGCGLR